MDRPQKTVYEMECENNPLDGLIQIDMIGVQRGFFDSDADKSTNSKKLPFKGNLTNQLRNYYNRHLNPEQIPTSEDISALEAIKNAQDIFDLKLEEKFRTAISELETLGYPGMTNPRIKLSTKINPIDALNHKSAVQYTSPSSECENLSLPKHYNGLGYQNLISMVFLLIQFRDDWMKVGKVKTSLKPETNNVPPIHLVLIEEPEVHLHVQVQQVFIRKAYEVLVNDEFLSKNDTFKTQLVISITF